MLHCHRCCWPRLSPPHNGAVDIWTSYTTRTPLLSMTHFLDILHLFLALLPPALTQTMDAYNSTEEVEEAESFFSSMDFHVSRQSVFSVM